LFDGALSRSQRRLRRFEGSLRGGAKLGGFLVRFRLGRPAGVRCRGLRLFGGDARQIKNQAGQRFTTGWIGQHLFEGGQPPFERFAQNGKRLLCGFG
jgi:hypothetical protein